MEGSKAAEIGSKLKDIDTKYSSRKVLYYVEKLYLRKDRELWVIWISYYKMTCLSESL